MEAEGGSEARSSYVLVPMGEPPSTGAFLNQTVFVTGGGGIVGHALIGRILREGGASGPHALPATACYLRRATPSVTCPTRRTRRCAASCSFAVARLLEMPCPSVGVPQGLRDY